jgi:hypothetical protein
MINILLPILLISDAFNFFLVEDAERIDKFTIGNNNNLMTLGIPGGYYFFSSDGGRTFNQSIPPKQYFWNSSTRNVQYRNGQFIYHHDYSNIMRFDSEGIFIDSFQLSTDFKFPHILATNENYCAALYEKEYNSSSYSIVFSRDNFDTDSAITFHNNLDSNLFRNLDDIDLLEDNLFYSLNELEFVDTNVFYTSKYIRFNLESKKSDTLINIKHNEEQTWFNKYFPIDKDTHFLLETKLLEREEGDNRSPRIYSLYLYDNNQLVFIDTLKSARFSEKFFGVIHDKYFYLSNYLQYLWRFDLDNLNNTEHIVTNLYLHAPKLGSSAWGSFAYNYYNDKYLYNFGVNVFLEVDLNLLFEINSIESAESYSNIYPNPAKKGNIIHLEFEELVNNIEIIDLSGKITLEINRASDNYKINSNDLSPGIYFALIYFGKDLKQLSFVVE